MSHPHARHRDAHEFKRASLIELKITEDCNLKCTYCCVDATAMGKGRSMTLETHGRVAEFLLPRTEAPRVTWTFHGGEPLVMGEEFFREACRQAREAAARNPNIRALRFAAQTNGTLINDRSLAWIEELRIAPLLSFDGLPEVNSLLRGGTRGTQAALRRVLERTPDAGITCVLTPQLADKIDAMMDYLAGLGIKPFMLVNMQPVGRGAHSHALEPERTVGAWERVLDRMLAEGPGGLCESEILIRMEHFASTHERGTKFVPRTGCRTFNCFGGYEFVAVDPTGTLHPCGRAIESGNWTLGDAHAPPDAERVHVKLEDLHRKDGFWTRCVTCDASRVCFFSCAAYDRIDPNIREQECRQTKLFYQSMLARQDAILAYIAARRAQPGRRTLPVAATA